MSSVAATIWSGFFQPILQRPKPVQLAALCYRIEHSRLQVLLVTSRGTGRWILPKGWPIKGTNSAGTALQEAWEEAGVTDGDPGDHAIGTYCYDKTLNSGLTTPVETSVYPVEVTALTGTFPEAAERNRQWFAPEEAANLVAEPELCQMLKEFADRTKSPD